MSTEAPDDLAAFRNTVMVVCGFGDPNEVGIKGDVAHAARGGYHISTDDIAATGRLDTDFSTKRARDHFRPNRYASAVDIGDDWPNGGRAAWLRFNNAVLFDLSHNFDMLTSVRAMNLSTDGSNRKRYDRANADDGLINSTDTVNIHTHLEFWRDTRGTAARTADLARLLVHVRTAIHGALPPAPDYSTETMMGSDMIFTVTAIPANTPDATGASMTEGGQYFATPDGPFGLTGSEFFSLPADAQPVRMKMAYPRIVMLCNALRVDPVDAEELAQEIAEAYPTDEITAQVIADAVAPGTDAAAHLKQYAFEGAQQAEQQ
jgi:hypothetical protein